MTLRVSRWRLLWSMAQRPVYIGRGFHGFRRWAHARGLIEQVDCVLTGITPAGRACLVVANEAHARHGRPDPMTHVRARSEARRQRKAA